MITWFQIWKARNRGRKINMQHKKFEYDKESHKKIIYKKTMVLYIKMMKYTKNGEHAKNLHDKDEHENTRKMMCMKIIYMRKINTKIREERWARKESTRERWTREYEK